MECVWREHEARELQPWWLLLDAKSVCTWLGVREDAAMHMHVRRERRACVLRARGNKGEDTMDEEATASMVQVCGYVQRRGARVRQRVRLCLRARPDERACVFVGAGGTETTLMAIPQQSMVAGVWHGWISS